MLLMNSVSSFQSIHYPLLQVNVIDELCFAISVYPFIPSYKWIGGLVTAAEK